MRLAHKVSLLLGISILGSLGLTTSLELRVLRQRLVEENETLHRTILANLTENLAGALYNVDSVRVERQLMAAFEFGAIQLIAAFDENKKLLAAFGIEDRDQGKQLRQLDPKDPAVTSLTVELIKPNIATDTKVLDLVSPAIPIRDGKRAIASLWFQNEEQKTFVGYVVLEFSEDKVRAAITQTQIEKILSTMALSLLIFTISFVFLRSLVIRRLERLEEAVLKIEKRDYNVEVEVSGNDEISDLSHAFRSMLSEIRSYQSSLESKVAEQTQDIRHMLIELGDKTSAISAILDNVEFGLLRCDKNGKILNGYSRSCLQLLESHQRTLDGQLIWEALGMFGRDAENFLVLYLQSLEDSLLADDLITQLPRRVCKDGRYLALHGAVILNEDKQVDSVLFSISDVSKLVEVEGENENNQALLRILRSRRRFVELIRQTLCVTSEDPKHDEAEVHAILLQTKRSLHTWKGDFSVFGLSSFSSLLHEIEESLAEKGAIETELLQFRNEVKAYLEKNCKILGIHPDDLDRQLFALDEQSLDELEEHFRQVVDLNEARDLIADFLDRSRSEPASNFLEFLLEAAHEQARRQGKELTVELEGGEKRIPLVYTEVLTNVVHILRNAVDHGIEVPHLRRNKPRRGSIKIEFREEAEAYVLQITDDGQGIDTEAIRRKVLSQQWIPEHEWNELSDEQQMNFIFRSGFSTKQDVSESSGRGIGLDAVAHVVRSFGGSIKVSSVRQQGTCFTIILPRKPMRLR